MGILGRRVKRRESEPPKEAEESSVRCPHTMLDSHWDNAQDMGQPDKVSSYRCEACGSAFSGEDGQRLIAEEAGRVAEIERLEDQ